MNSRVITLIPAYEPDEKMLKLTDELKEAGFETVIVDDGSGSERSVSDIVYIGYGSAANQEAEI